ncbi:hypothetical protein [Proteiniphilum sp. UBA5384]|uniref:hypothetical protein n=1 Tax=Proteiniphilum sp. UBA5384 TaxID=1947279 RepID=UPI0025EC2113|nr:hypothetical protein [Proteiniphilum sp. UBA5384]
MKKEEFKQKTIGLINELADYITKLEDKAGEIADDAKEEYSERLEKLKEMKDNLSSKLYEYEQVADSKWDVVRESATNFLGSVCGAWKENFDKVADAFKKEKMTGNNRTFDDDTSI